MRALISVLALAACSSKPAPATTPPPTPGDVETATPKDEPTAAIEKETLAADTPRTTVAGTSFVAPAGWSLWTRDAATFLSPPEGGSHIVLVDLVAASADEALATAWKLYKPDAPWKVLASAKSPDQEGWSQITNYQYQTSPSEKRIVGASTMSANGMWTVVLVDFEMATAEKRGGQLNTLFGKLLPKGGARESFAGKPAAKLDKARIAQLSTFIETGMKELRVPGVAIGLVQDGKVVFAGGFGVRQQGKPAKVDADTKFAIASNTKALTTLMLAKLVDENKLTWDTPAVQLLPTFKLGNADTTSKVLVKHLICACTGMPRQDLEWLLEFKDLTPAKVMDMLGTMQPTSKFGELFQYSNPLAAAAGFIGAHAAYPKAELGKAYDDAMQSRVFGPLAMRATTLDFKKGQTGNFAAPHSHDLKDQIAPALNAINYSVVPVRPAGGAWSTVRDLLKYVQMELDEGKLPGGKAYLAKDTLMARRAPQVAIGTDASYGMGLMTSTKYGTPFVHHGGDLIGFHSDMMWLPEHNVGAVILTNGDAGATIRSLFGRKLLEVLFDGKPEADAELAAAAKAMFETRAAERKLWQVPAHADAAGKLAKQYKSDALGGITVVSKGGATIFDFGEYQSEMASKTNPDGSLSFITIAPGIEGIELVAGTKDGKRTLTIRDAQHEYVFVEQ